MGEAGTVPNSVTTRMTTVGFHVRTFGVLHPVVHPFRVVRLHDLQVDDLYVIVRGNVKHIRELQKEKDNANCSADFWRHGTSDPFSKQPKASNSKYEHIKSPVAAYCKDPSSLKRRRSRAQRKALLESGRAKVRLI